MSQAPYGNPPPSSGGGNTLMIILVVVVVLGLICAGICGGCYWAVNTAINEGGKAVTVLVLGTQAQMAVQQNDEVKAKLGEPLSFSEVKNQKITAASSEFDFDVTGPQGTATVHVQASQTPSGPEIKVLQVKFADGTTVDVDPKVQFSPDVDMPEDTFPGINPSDFDAPDPSATPTAPESSP